MNHLLPQSLPMEHGVPCPLLLALCPLLPLDMGHGIRRSMEHGARSMVFLAQRGAWSMVHGAWCSLLFAPCPLLLALCPSLPLDMSHGIKRSMEHGVPCPRRSMEHGARSMVFLAQGGAWSIEHGAWCSLPKGEHGAWCTEHGVPCFLLLALCPLLSQA